VEALSSHGISPEAAASWYAEGIRDPAEIAAFVGASFSPAAVARYGVRTLEGLERERELARQEREQELARAEVERQEREQAWETERQERRERAEAERQERERKRAEAERQEQERERAEEDARWSDEGIDSDEREEWERHDILTARSAIGWRRMGLSPSEARAWRKDGIAPDHARPSDAMMRSYRRHLPRVSHSMAARLLAARVRPADVQRLRDAGVRSPAKMVQLRRSGEDAMLLEDHRLRHALAEAREAGADDGVERLRAELRWLRTRVVGVRGSGTHGGWAYVAPVLLERVPFRSGGARWGTVKVLGRERRSRDAAWRDAESIAEEMGLEIVRG
jgi:hypothetical protein